MSERLCFRAPFSSQRVNGSNTRFPESRPRNRGGRIAYLFNVVDGKDGDQKGTYVNIEARTDSNPNPDTMFETMINDQNESLEIVIEDPSAPVKRQNTH